jgi:hypothetical protein
MRAQFIVVSGIPASGKSTLGRLMADALNLPMLDKDEILEGHFESLGIGDASWRAKLSRLADEELCKQAGARPSSVIISWWRHPLSKSNSGTPIEWLRVLAGELVEVYCSCSASVAATRFLARQRHAGHLDCRYTYAELLAEFEQQASFGPLGVGRIVRVNTETAPEIAAIAAEVLSKQS